MNRVRLAEIVRFCIVGSLSFLVDYGLLYFFTEFCGIHYFYSSAISFTVSVVLNYWLCIRFVFIGIGRQTTRQVVLFVGSSVVGLALNQLCMWFFVELCGLYYMLAKIAATVVVTVWNYVMKRKAVSGENKYDA